MGFICRAFLFGIYIMIGLLRTHTHPTVMQNWFCYYCCCSSKKFRCRTNKINIKYICSIISFTTSDCIPQLWNEPFTRLSLHMNPHPYSHSDYELLLFRQTCAIMKWFEIRSVVGPLDLLINSRMQSMVIIVCQFSSKIVWIS